MRSFVLAVAMAASAAPVAAQIDPVVQGQLEAAVEMMADAGYSLRGEFRSGGLANGAEETLSIDLVAGTTYAILGVCDADCSDMDLMLIDAAGRMIAQDILEDDVPILTPEITAGGTYGLRVTMPACSVDPCSYAIAIFTQD
jgi:hypothetical protein